MDTEKMCRECGVELERREDFICDECEYNLHLDAEPDQDDSIHFCPDCERPNQFGEICAACEYERQIGIAEDRL